MGIRDETKDISLKIYGKETVGGSVLQKKSIYDNAIGSIFGLVAGDRIEGPTRMALILGNNLISNRAYKNNDLLNDYLLWWKKEGIDTGPTAAKVFSSICSGKNPEQAVREVHLESNQRTAGCNPMHRSIPIAAASFIPLGKIQDVSRLEARLTHYDEIAGKMASISNRLCRYFILGESIEYATSRVLGNEKNSYMTTSRQDLETNGYAPNVLRAALYFLLNSSSFEEALVRSIRFAGPSNYSSVIVGSWAGALYGFSDIPKKYYSHCAIITEIVKMSKKISADFKQV